MSTEKKIIFEKNGKAFEKKIIIFQNEEEIQILSNSTAWKIMKTLANKPQYTAQIAK